MTAFPTKGGGLGGALQAASPLLMAMSANLLTPPNQRDPQAMQRGLMGMMQMQQQREADERRMLQ